MADNVDEARQIVEGALQEYRYSPNPSRNDRPWQGEAAAQGDRVGRRPHGKITIPMSSGRAKVDELVGRLAENDPATGEKVLPATGGDRILFLCWKGSASEWLHMGSQVVWSTSGRSVR